MLLVMIVVMSLLQPFKKTTETCGESVSVALVEGMIVYVTVVVRK